MKELSGMCMKRRLITFNSCTSFIDPAMYISVRTVVCALDLSCAYK